MTPRKGSGALLQHCIAPEIRFKRCASQKKAGVSWPLDDAVTNEMLKRILFPERATAETLHTQPDCPYIHKELARPGVNLTLLWTEYCRRCKNSGTTPYMYTQSVKNTSVGTDHESHHANPAQTRRCHAGG